MRNAPIWILMAPLVLVWAFALVELFGRKDLTSPRKVGIAAVLLVFLPVSILYLLARPASVVSYTDRTKPGWRDDLVNSVVGRSFIEIKPGLSRSELASMVAERTRLDETEALSDN